MYWISSNCHVTIKTKGISHKLGLLYWLDDAIMFCQINSSEISLNFKSFLMVSPHLKSSLVVKSQR